MTERSYEDAVQTLRNHIGGRWEGLQDEGHDEMVRILRRELGYDANSAKMAIDEMIQSGQIRYHHAGAHGDSQDMIDDTPAPIATSPVASGSGGLPGMAFNPDVGYWEIGPGSETGWESRAGQVDPT